MNFSVQSTHLYRAVINGDETAKNSLLNSHLSKEDYGQIETVVNRYSALSSKSRITYLVYRIQQTILAIFGRSDWQKAYAALQRHFVVAGCLDLYQASLSYPHRENAFIAAELNSVQIGKMLGQLVWETKPKECSSWCVYEAGIKNLSQHFPKVSLDALVIHRGYSVTKANYSGTRQYLDNVFKQTGWDKLKERYDQDNEYRDKIDAEWSDYEKQVASFKA